MNNSKYSRTLVVLLLVLMLLVSTLTVMAVYEPADTEPPDDCSLESIRRKFKELEPERRTPVPQPHNNPDEVYS